jgi:hypothetical protein
VFCTNTGNRISKAPALANDTRYQVGQTLVLDRARLRAVTLALAAGAAFGLYIALGVALSRTTGQTLMPRWGVLDWLFTIMLLYFPCRVLLGILGVRPAVPVLAPIIHSAPRSSIFLARRFDDRKRKPGFEAHHCKWCGVRTHAAPTSPAYESGECGDCRGAVGTSVRECAVHGKYPVVIQGSGTSLGECILCYQDGLCRERRRDGECDICGEGVNPFARLAGETRCKAHR